MATIGQIHKRTNHRSSSSSSGHGQHDDDTRSAESIASPSPRGSLSRISSTVETSISLISLLLLVCPLVLIVFVQISSPQQQYQSSFDTATSTSPVVTILPPIQQRPNVHVNIRDWTRKFSDELQLLVNRTGCSKKIEQMFEKQAEYQQLNPEKARDSIIGQINYLLGQHKNAVNAIVTEAEKVALAHNFNKSLQVNYTDVHRIRNELDPLAPGQDPTLATASDQYSFSSGGGAGGGQLGQTAGPPGVPQFTSINGGTPVPGKPEWQTPFKSIMMQMNRNFGEVPVNTSMSAVHLPLPIYAGLPEIMNSIAWTERLDSVFKRNLAQYMHVHHQYYGDHLGFLRTFPAHKWRIPRNEPDLFDARTRPWYVAGASSPKNVVILVDTSGSMTGLRREIAKGVVFEILDTLTSNDYFAVMRFSESVTPMGFPKCNLRQPRLFTQLNGTCNNRRDRAMDHARDHIECANFERQLRASRQYLEDNPDIVLGKNGSYLMDDAYLKSIANITQDISGSYLLPATSRNIRYLKSNFTLPTAGIANFTNALMAAFELLQAYNRTGDLGSQCNQAIMLITDGAIRSHDDIFNRYNYPNAPVRLFSYMIGREVGDITHTKAMACKNRGYYTHVINLSEVREQVQKYLPVLARPLVLAHNHPTTWTLAYGDETYQVLTDWVLEIKRRERARIMLNEERERLNEANSSDVINIELTGIPEYDDLTLVDEQLKNRIICEDPTDNSTAMEQSLGNETDPLGYNDLACHWVTRRADLLTSVVKPVFDQRNTSIFFERRLSKNVWTEQETHLRNAQLLGVAAVDLRIADIMRAAPSHQLGPNGYAILIGQNGFIMHHPDLRALLEDPFDKQSKILKPFFNNVDLTQIEQVFSRNETAQLARPLRAIDMKLMKLREAALRRATGEETLTVKRAIDCRRRPQIRQLRYFYGPIKDSPFSLMLVLPHGYGQNRLVAKLPLNEKIWNYLSPSDYDLWTVHPDYRYCEQVDGPLSRRANNSDEVIVKLMELAKNQDSNIMDHVKFDDLGSFEKRAHSTASGSVERFVCDKELFPSLLFDAMATYESPNSTCGSGPFDYCDSTPYRSFYGRSRQREESCAWTPEQLSPHLFYLSIIHRSKLVEISGVEMTFLATRSGLTRARVFDLSPRIKKLVKIFIERHNRAVDESWYQRTVDWNMRFNEDATIFTAPYNAYVRLVAKLRQRITERHPIGNDTRTNCDPEEFEEGSGSADVDSSNGTLTDEQLVTSTSNSANTMASSANAAIQNDDPSSSVQGSGPDQTGTEGVAPSVPRINYNEYSTYDFLDLLVNSSVHIYATQSVIPSQANHEQRSPVAVTGQLYDYATFARRFLNQTTLNIMTTNNEPYKSQESSVDQAGQLGTNIKVDICPKGECPTRCGLRNDTIDCLLVDNNGFIVVGEELPYIGRSLADYDEKLLQSLVEKKVFHQVILMDFQAICARSDQADVKPSALGSSMLPTSSSASASSQLLNNPLRLGLAKTVLSNFASALIWTATKLYSTMFLFSAMPAPSPSDLFEGESWLGQLYHWHRSAIMSAEAQSAVANQSLMAMLPNKTYLRPCEKPVTLYETRPNDSKSGSSKMTSDTPEYFVTKCNCSGWYVYDVIPKTNLIMLIVNTTSACRRCDPPPVQPPAPIVQLTGPSSDPTQQAPLSSSSYIMPGTIAPNKTAEDLVCAMLERDSQLFVQKSGSCLTSHPDEAGIHICGAAAPSAPISNPLILFSLLILLLIQLLSL